MDLKRVAILVALLVGCAHAQFIGYVSPQTVQQTLATNVACTGSNQVFPINNLGQTQHYLTISSLSINVNTISGSIQGVDANGIATAISDNLLGAGTVSASGYFPKPQVVILCTGGSFSATYSGAWGTFNVNSGAYLAAQLQKLLFFQAPESANQSASFVAPFGSTAGSVRFQYTAAGAGGSFSIACTTTNSGIVSTVYTSPLANTTALQVFNIPAFNCSNVIFSYSNNGTSGAIYAEYVLNPPGTGAPPGYQYTHVAGTTATVVKGTAPAFLHTLTVNTSAAGTISIFDLATAACTGTPATNTVAVITAIASSPPENLLYDTNFLNGICVKASVAMDFTVSAQ